MNYFELYEIPVSFLPDEKMIRNKYLQRSRQYHPDYYSTSTPEKQQEILLQSTENNNAFRVLSDFDRRMKYILISKGILEEEEKYNLPQAFLMEMMELNEALMEIQFDRDTEMTGAISLRIDAADDQLLKGIYPVLESYTENSATESDYRQIKEFYYKRRYLLRLREQLSKF